MLTWLAVAVWRSVFSYFIAIFTCDSMPKFSGTCARNSTAVMFTCALCVFSSLNLYLFTFDEEPRTKSVCVYSICHHFSIDREVVGTQECAYLQL